VVRKRIAQYRRRGHWGRYTPVIFARRFIRFWFAATLVLGTGAVAAAAKPAVVGLRIGVHAETTRVVLDLTDGLEYRVFTLPSPYRVVVDLPEVAWKVSAKRLSSGRGIVQRFRYGLFQPGTSRLVLDLKAPVRLRKVFMLRPTANFGYRLVLDLEAVSAKDYRREGEPTPLAAPKTTPSAGAKTTPERNGPIVIAIDPGHGGVDPGTQGTSGVYEKWITLAAARELARQLKATGRYRVVLTRDRDVFVPLPQRVAIARKAGADLFISLHADSIANHKVRGASIYTLSENASDAETAALAAKENKADVIAGIDLSSQVYDAEVANILIDLAQRQAKNESGKFVEALVPELGKSVRLLRKTHRYAGFRVLKAPDVPSVLIEMGYLSNPRDERMLRTPKTRAKLMAAIRRAIDRYFAAKLAASQG